MRALLCPNRLQARHLAYLKITMSSSTKFIYINHAPLPRPPSIASTPISNRTKSASPLSDSGSASFRLFKSDGADGYSGKVERGRFASEGQHFNYGFSAATMTKIIKEMLPPDVRVARDAQDLIIECCVEFINLVSSESNEVCYREDRRTIAPEHVLRALEILGFGEYIEEVYSAYEQHKLETMQDSLKGGKWSNGAEMTEEEAVLEQQRMFAEARARMNGGAAAPKQPEADQSLES